MSARNTLMALKNALPPTPRALPVARERGNAVDCTPRGWLTMDTHLPNDATLLPHSAHWGAFSVRRGHDGIEIVPHPHDPAPSPLWQPAGGVDAPRADIPAGRAPRLARTWTRRRSPPRPRRVRPRVVGQGARPRRRRIATRLCGIRTARRLRRLLWLVERRPFPPCERPASSLPQHGRRLRPLSPSNYSSRARRG